MTHRIAPALRPRVERLEPRDVPTGGLGGSVFLDADNDGVFDSGESGIEGVTVNLRAPNANGSTDVVASTVTGTGGSYFFNDLTPGQYWVEEVQPSGYADGIDTAGSFGGGVVQANDIISAVNVYDMDFSGDNNFAERTAAALSGFVGEVESDGTTFKAPISGVTVKLYKGVPGQGYARVGVGEGGRGGYGPVAPCGDHPCPPRRCSTAWLS